MGYRYINNLGLVSLVFLSGTGALLAEEVSQVSALVLDRVMVVGDPSQVDEISGSAQVIDEQELDKHDYSDINRVLSTLPGINLQEEDGYGLRPNIGMRGTGVDRSSKITVMEDGVLIAPAPYAAPSAYYFPMTGRMQTVEVMKGPAAIKHGPNTNGGALNLISRSVPDQLRGSVSFKAGDDRLRETHAFIGDSKNNFGWLAETFQISNDGFKQLDNGAATGIDVADYMMKFRINSDADSEHYQELELKLGATDELSNLSYLGLTEADFDATPFRRYAASQKDVMDAEHQQYQLRHHIQASDKVDITSTLYRNDFKRNWYKLNKVDGAGISSILADPVSFANEYAVIVGGNSVADALEVKANNREYYSQGIESIVGVQLQTAALDHDIEVGIRYHEDEEDRHQWVDDYQMINGTMVLTTAGTPGTGNKNNRVASAEALALFVQDEIRFGNFIMTPGVRYEDIELTREDYGSSDPGRTTTPTTVDNDVSAVTPGIGISYQVNDAVTVLAGIHKGFTAPGPGTQADAEESINTELGLRYRQDGFNAEAIGFYNQYDNLLGTCTASSGGSCTAGDQFDGGEVDVVGLEAVLGYDIGAARDFKYGIPLRLAYTYTKAEFQNSFDSSFGEWGDVLASDELPYIPQQQLSAGIGVLANDWSLNLHAKYTDEMRAVAGQGSIPDSELIADHWVVDLAGEYRLKGTGRLFLAVENLTDEVYMAARRPAGARPGKPRTVTAGFRAEF